MSCTHARTHARTHALTHAPAHVPAQENERLQKLLAELQNSKKKADADCAVPEKTAKQPPTRARKDDSDNHAAPQSEAAEKHRLRRICEKKPSGRINVPEHVHLKWKNGGTDRDELLEQLREANWKKDTFLSYSLYRVFSNLLKP